MRLLVVSDVHDKVSIYQKIVASLRSEFDATIVAGDLTYFKPFEHGVKILKSMRDFSGRPVFFVAGNCDSPRLLTWEGENDIINLHRKLVSLGSHYIYGIGGGNISPFHTMIEWSEDEFKSMLPTENSRVCGKLLMVTHTPINQFFDEVNGYNIGSISFREFLHQCNPTAWVTGHVHEHSGVVKNGRTTIVHPGPLMRGYYGIMELGENEVVAEVRRLG
ncbi:MAG: metallophosphoesterase [Thermosphaera sp.]